MLENLMPAKEGFDNFRKRFGVKNVKMTGEIASAKQAAANEFLDVIKKIIEEKDIFLNRFLI